MEFKPNIGSTGNAKLGVTYKTARKSHTFFPGLTLSTIFPRISRFEPEAPTTFKPFGRSVERTPRKVLKDLKECSEITLMVAPVSTAKDSGNVPTLHSSASLCVFERAAVTDRNFCSSSTLFCLTLTAP